MRNNMKNCPDSEWKKGFEKELREIQTKRPWLYAEFLAKEILGDV